MTGASILTPALCEMLERIERLSGRVLIISVIGHGGRSYSHLERLRNAGFVVKCDSDVKDRWGYPAEALAITEAGRKILREARK